MAGNIGDHSPSSLISHFGFAKFSWVNMYVAASVEDKIIIIPPNLMFVYDDRLGLFGNYTD